MSLPTTVDPLPSTYVYGKVVARVIHAIGDTAEDTDDKPQARAAAGKVHFNPRETIRRVTDADYTAIVMHQRETANLSSTGRILDAEGRQGIWLITGVYDVTFEFGAGAKVPPLVITVGTEHTDAAPLDLVTAVPYIPPTGVTVTTLLVPANGADGQVLTWSATSSGLVWSNPATALTWDTLTGKPAVIAAGTSQTAARNAIGAGTSNLALGTGSTTAKAGNYTPSVADVPALPTSKITGLDTALTGKASTTRQVASGTGLTGGGDLSADRTLAVSYGTTAGTAAQGNDSRVLAGGTAVQPAGLTKSAVGLGNADNTSDAAKPVSTATQTALGGKVTTTTNTRIDSGPTLPAPGTPGRIFIVTPS